MLDDRQASQLDLVGRVGLNDLKVRDDRTVVRGDEYPAQMQVGIQLQRRVLGKREQEAQFLPRSRVPPDLDASGQCLAGPNGAMRQL
jgi:hypothetical protein